MMQSVLSQPACATLRNNFVKALLARCKEITTIIQNINPRHTNVILGEKENILYGKGFIIDTLCGINFKISPKSFYQINKQQCEKLYTKAIDLATRYGTRLHVLHLTTAKELALFSNKPATEKKITAETCVGYLWFDDNDYERLNAKIKCNPAIKKEKSRVNLLKAIEMGYIDTVATDHAPHLLSEKEGDCLQAVSGFPSIQHSLPMMLNLAKKGNFTREQVVEKMCHNPAKIFNIEKRGFIRKGFFADLVLIEPNYQYTVEQKDLEYKCGWSPMEGATLNYKVCKTFVNGKLVYDEGKIDDSQKGKLLTFTR